MNGFVMGWKGSAPNKSWLPFMLLRRGVIAFGGGATKIEYNRLAHATMEKFKFVHNGGGDEWFVKLLVVPSVKLPELKSC